MGESLKKTKQPIKNSFFSRKRGFLVIKRLFLSPGLLGLIFFLVLNLVPKDALAWTEPSASPPGGNVAAPLNTSSTAQTKTGALTILGNVSVGTVNPSATPLPFYSLGARALEIIGNPAAEDEPNTTGVLMLVNNRTTPATGDNIGQIDFVSANDSAFQKQSAGIVAYLTGNGGSLGFGSALTFWTKGDNTTTFGEKMHINEAGKVGIGTANPQTPLHVRMTANGIPLLLETTEAGDNSYVGAGFSFDAGSDTAEIRAIKPSGGNIATDLDLRVHDGISWNTGVYIKSSNSDGVGIAGPTKTVNRAKDKLIGQPGEKITDGTYLPEGADWQDPAAVSWEGNGWTGVGLPTDRVFVIDLGETYSLSKVKIQADNNDTYIIEYSPDANDDGGGHWSPLYKASRVWGGAGLRTREFELLNKVSARRVRVYPYIKGSGDAYGDGRFSISELQVFENTKVLTVTNQGRVGIGTINPKSRFQVNDNYNVAAGKTVALYNPSPNCSVNGGADVITDGQYAAEGAEWRDIKAVWLDESVVGACDGATLTVDLGDIYNISGVKIQADFNDLYLIEYSPDANDDVGGGHWDTLFTAPAGSGGLSTRASESLGEGLKEVSARRVRIKMAGGDHRFAVSELEILQSPLPNTFMVTDQGKVGIGTEPVAKLTVTTNLGKAGSDGDTLYAYANSANAAVSAEQTNTSGWAGYFSGKVFANKFCLGTEGDCKQDWSSVAGLWKLDGTGISPNQNGWNVGIGATPAGAKLTVAGGASVAIEATSTSNNAISGKTTSSGTAIYGETTNPNGRAGYFTAGANGLQDTLAIYSNSANKSAIYAEQQGAGYAGSFSGKVKVSTDLYTMNNLYAGITGQVATFSYNKGTRTLTLGDVTIDIAQGPNQLAITNGQLAITKFSAKCNYNGICEPKYGENRWTCPYDCLKIGEPPGREITSAPINNLVDQAQAASFIPEAQAATADPDKIIIESGNIKISNSSNHFIRLMNTDNGNDSAHADFDFGRTPGYGVRLSTGAAADIQSWWDSVSIPLGKPLYIQNIAKDTYINAQNGGLVGIGTNAPDLAYKLTVNGKIKATDFCIGGGNCLSTAGGGGLWRLTGASSLSPNSLDYNVGIGTRTPNGKFSVSIPRVHVNSATQTGLIVTVSPTSPFPTLLASEWASGLQLVFDDGTNAGTITDYNSVAKTITVSIQNVVNPAQGCDILYTGLQVGKTLEFPPLGPAKISAGKVGIGIVPTFDSPYLTVSNDPAKKGSLGDTIYAYASSINAAISADQGGSGWAGYFSGRAYFSGNVGIGIETTGRKLDVAGDASINNNLLAHLEGGFYYGRMGLKESRWDLSNVGTSWTQRSDQVLWAGVAMSSDGKYQTAITNNGPIYISSNYGITWTTTGLSTGHRGVAMSSDGKYQTAVVGGGKIYISSDYGANWADKDSPREWRGVAMSSDGKYQTAVVTSGVNPGYIYVSSNYGVGWTEKDTYSGPWEDVAMSSDGKYQVALGGSFPVKMSSNYGVTWTDIFSLAGKVWHDVAMSSDGKDIAIVGTGASCALYASSDYGVTWANKTALACNDVAMSSDGQYLTATTNGGKLYISSNYGASWTEGNSNIRKWAGVAMSSDGKYQTAVEAKDSPTNGYIHTSYATSSMIKGDIATLEAGAGIIVKSPDGTKCKRIGIDNSGGITTTDCP